MFGQVASLLVADEVLAVPHMLSSFTGREIDPVHVHSIGVPSWLGGSGCLSQWDEGVSPTSESPESYHVPVELSCLVKPLFPLSACLFLSFRKDSGSHHDSKLVGYPSLKGIHQDAIEVDSTVSLSQSKDSGILIKVTIELVHAEGINSLTSSVLYVLQDEGFFKGIT